jgi:hypothetical protein
MRENLLKLAEYQELDLKVAQLRKEVEKRFEESPLKELKSELASVEKEFSAKVSQLDKERLKQKKAEGELELLEEKIKREQKKLYSGAVKNPKELASINQEIESLKRHLDEGETELLIIIEKVEEVTREANELKSKVDSLKNQIAEEEKALEGFKLERESQIEELNGKIKNLEPAVGPDLLRLYQKLKKEVAGMVLARLVDGVCQGCHMQLPAEEVDKMVNQPDKLWYCPHCLRLLLVKEG